MKIIKVQSHNELFFKFKDKPEPQKCFIEIDCKNNTISAIYDPEESDTIVPLDVWCGFKLRFRISILTSVAANALMGEIFLLAERVTAGFNIEWNGKKFVGIYSNDSIIAQEKIDDICQSVSENKNCCIQCYAADDWLDDLVFFKNGELVHEDEDYTVVKINKKWIVNHQTTDLDIQNISSEIETTVENLIVYDIQKLLEILRDNCRDNV